MRSSEHAAHRLLMHMCSHIALVAQGLALCVIHVIHACELVFGHLIVFSLHPSLYFFLQSFFHLFLMSALMPDEISMEDPLCDSSFGSMVTLDYVTPDTIPVGVDILSRKTYLRETRSRRVAQLEHNINDDKNLWSGVVEWSKWIGVSAFHLSIAVTPLVMRTGKGREPGTGYSKPFVQPKRRPRDVSWSHLPRGTW